ncbi:hypothetical protein [Aneurinibacillus sp. REN35]|uniref:hypothetical protein n=1 Tax=Aneurinibacillus sp. REN35 TaxID=3237286 RepID=UPI003528F8E8
MRFLLELIRVLVLLLLLGGLLGTVLKSMYTAVGVDLSHNEYSWLIGISILLLLLVLYRNMLQFSGWYVGKGRKKLPPRMSLFLVLCSAALLVVVPFLG